MFANGATGRSAAQAYLRRLGQRRKPLPVLAAIRFHAAIFSSDPATLGEAACALARVDKWAEIIQWFGEWRKRVDLPAWALANLSAALDALGNESEAEEVARRALSAPRDHSTDGHRARVAFGAASRGEREETGKLLTEIDEENLSTNELFLVRVTQALLMASDADRGGVETPYWRAFTLLSRAAALAPGYRNNRLLNRAWNRAAWQIARSHSRTVLGAVLKWMAIQYG